MKSSEAEKECLLPLPLFRASGVRVPDAIGGTQVIVGNDPGA
jgi:hypothetical protein